MAWPLGDLIDKRLKELDSEHDEWTVNRLAKEAGFSPSYMQYVVKGRTSGRDYPPSISIEKGYAIAKALMLPFEVIWSAYLGVDADAEKTLSIVNEMQYTRAVKAFLKELPPAIFEEVMKERFGDRFNAVRDIAIQKSKGMNNDEEDIIV